MARTPSEDEAAAIAAAIERFRLETTLSSAAEKDNVSPWQRAALLEGVGAKAPVEDSEGGERWLS